MVMRCMFDIIVSIHARHPERSLSIDIQPSLHLQPNDRKKNMILYMIYDNTYNLQVYLNMDWTYCHV